MAGRTGVPATGGSVDPGSLIGAGVRQRTPCIEVGSVARCRQLVVLASPYSYRLGVEQVEVATASNVTPNAIGQLVTGEEHHPINGTPLAIGNMRHLAADLKA